MELWCIKINKVNQFRPQLTSKRAKEVNQSQDYLLEAETGHQWVYSSNSNRCFMENAKF